MYTTSVEVENSQKLQTALVHFIVNRAEGDMLRDIAIRTLKDLNAKYERAYYGTNELKVERFKEVIKPKQIQQVTKREINTFARMNLIKLRKQTFLGQEKFAKIIKLSCDHYRHFERGRMVIPIDVVVNVCTAFNIPIDKFLTDSI